MNRNVLSVCAVCLVLLLAATDLQAGKGGRGKPGGGKTSGTLTISPDQTSSPVTQQNPMNICVSGFSQGNFVSVQVPLTGSPDLYSVWSMNLYVDASGGFCFDAPPVWSDMRLEPGTYTVSAYMSPDGSRRSRLSASATFTVTGN